MAKRKRIIILSLIIFFVINFPKKFEESRLCALGNRKFSNYKAKMTFPKQKERINKRMNMLKLQMLKEEVI